MGHLRVSDTGMYLALDVEDSWSDSNICYIQVSSLYGRCPYYGGWALNPAFDFDGQNTVFILGHYLSSGFYYQKLDISSTDLNWSNYIYCYYCTRLFFSAVINEAKTLAYSMSMFTDGGTTYNILMAMNWSSGTTLANRYYQSTAVTKVNSVVEQGDNIYAIFMSTSGNKIGEFKGSDLTLLHTYQTSVNYNRFATGASVDHIITGEKSNDCVISQVPISRISDHPDIDNATSALLSLSSGTYSVTASTIYWYTWSMYWSTTSASAATRTITTNQSATFVDDVYAIFDEEEYNFTYAEEFEIVPNVTCSQTGAADIVYSLQAVDELTDLPDFVEIDAVTGVLTGTSASPAVETLYEFNINSTWDFGSTIKLMRVNVEAKPPDPVADGAKAGRKAIIIISGFTCGPFARSLTVFISAIILACLLFMYLKFKAPVSSLWIIINYLQLITFFILLDIYPTTCLYEFIKSQSYALFNFNFIPIRKAINGNEQPNLWLKELSIDSRSTFINSISLILVAILVSLAY